MNANLATQWTTDGYVTVDGLYTPDQVDRLLPICEAILERWRVSNPEKDEPGGGPDSTVMRHLNHPGYRDAVEDGPREILEAAADPRVLDVCEAILGEAPLFRTTSLFFNPLETSKDGNWHRDSQFGAKDDAEEQARIRAKAHPARAVQLQIALVPSDDVEFVPRSHTRWDTDVEYGIRKADDGAKVGRTTCPAPSASRCSPATRSPSTRSGCIAAATTKTNGAER